MNSPRRSVHPRPAGASVSSGRFTSRHAGETDDDYRRRMHANLVREYERRRRPGGRVRPREPVGPKPIEVHDVEFYAKNNATEHKTTAYELVDNPDPAVVLRRGQPFYIAIRFKRGYNPEKDEVKLQFEFGPEPRMVSKGTLVILPVGANKEFKKEKAFWDLRLHHHEGTVITVHVQVPATVAVGVWKMKIISYLKEGGGDAGRTPQTYDCKESIYILFNPWCKEDSVYMENESWRQEYVLNDTGKIFYGTKQQPKGRRWIYGQFVDSVLPAAMYILESLALDYTGRANPIAVVRGLSKLVNSEDDDGVLVGNWSGNYDDGVAPWTWTGSAAIMEQYLLTREPVKYGQCWVFAGVTTTVCRTLGIPCRTVTNFVSAHDTDRSLTVDRYFDASNEELEGMTGDSIWNFHVWNDCWMARPDLPKGYGGWQAIDATPQETSGEVFQMGPASLEAIRKGEVGFQFDCPFVFAEVNADIVHWVVDDNVEGGMRKAKSEKYSVGPFVLTKKVGVDDDEGDRDSENIVGEYKNQEGTVEERMAILNAARGNPRRTEIFDMPAPEAEDVFFDLQEIDRIMIGRPFSVTVKVENRSNQKRTLSVVLSASTVYYTGVLAKKVKRQRGSFTLQPRQSEVLGIQVTADEYFDKLVDYSMVKIYAIATVQETQQTWSEEDDFAVDKPKLRLDVPDTLRVGQEFQLHAHFTNPLQRVLTECLFTVEGPGLTQPHKGDYRNIQPGESIVYTERFTPMRPGARKLVVNFSARQLTEVLGSKQLNIVE